jgi:hypothetical protein
MFIQDDDTTQNQGDQFNEASAGASAPAPSSGAAVPPTAQPSPAAGSTAAAPAEGASAQAPSPSTSDDHSEGRDLGEGASAAKPSSSSQDTTKITGNSFGNRMLHGILNALGGSTDTLLERDSNPNSPTFGKMIATQVKSGPGSQWKRIIAGALTGAAAGASVAPGPGHLGRAAGAGFGAAAQQAEGIQESKRKNANEDFDTQQKATVTKAQHALLTQQIAGSAWEMKRSKMQYSMDAAKEFNGTQQLIASDPTHEDLGVYPSFADFVAKNNGKDTAKGLGDRLLQAVPELDADNNVIGVHGYRMTPGWGGKRNAEPVKIDMGGVVNGAWKEDWQTIPANGKTNDEIMQLKNAQTAAKSKFETEKYKEGEQNKREQTQANATVEAARTHANATVEAAKIGANSREVVAGTKASKADIRDHDKNYVLPAESVEKSYQTMQHAYDEYQDAKSKGKQLPTGAQSMQMLSAHIQNTFGAGKNTRITTDLIKKHMGAIGISDAAEVAINRLKNGDALSPDQWDAFHDLVTKARQLTWDTAVKQAKRKSIPVDFLPDDLNKKLIEGGDATKNVTVQTSDGKIWKNLDPQKLEDARKIDPNLKVLDNQ